MEEFGCTRCSRRPAGDRTEGREGQKEAMNRAIERSGADYRSQMMGGVIGRGQNLEKGPGEYIEPRCRHARILGLRNNER